MRLVGIAGMGICEGIFEYSDTGRKVVDFFMKGLCVCEDEAR